MLSRRRLRDVAAVGLICLAFAIPVGLLVERKYERERAYEAAHQQYEDAKRVSPPGAMFPGERAVTNPQGYREEWRGEYDLEAQREMADWAFAMLLASCAGVLITGVGVYYVAQTLKATHDAVGETARASLAAETAVEVTRVSAQRQLRAYVSSTNVNWTLVRKQVGDAPGIYQIFVHWKNCGQTPAKRCKTWTSYEVRKTNPPPDFDYPDKELPFESRSETVTIGPGQDFRGNVAIPTSIIPLVDNTNRIFVWGWIEYDDVFDDTPRRRTEICVRINVSEDGTKIQASAIGPFNGVDEGCRHQPKT